MAGDDPPGGWRGVCVQELMNAIFDTEDKARPRMEGAEGAGAPAPASPGAPRTMGGFGGHHPESDSSSSSTSASARISELFSSFKGSSSSGGGGGIAPLSHRPCCGPPLFTAPLPPLWSS